MVLVDTNVISDVIHADKKWEPWALERLATHFGELAINPIIYAELSCRAKSSEELDTVLDPFEFIYLEIPKEALHLAAQAFLRYRKRGGSKSSPLPDFFIGAHATTLEISILTRDKSRYQTYFPKAKLIAP